MNFYVFYQIIFRELFNASYMSIWTEMTSDEQREMSQAMLKALQSHIPEVVQTVLNLSEFMDHSEKVGNSLLFQRQLGGIEVWIIEILTYIYIW